MGSRIAATAIIAVAAGSLALALAGSWLASPTGQLIVASTLAGSIVAVVAWRATGRSWPAVLLLAWAGLCGLVLAGLGAPPEPWAGDVGPQPWVDDALALGGPRVAVGAVWVLAAVLGIVALAAGGRRRDA